MFDIFLCPPLCLWRREAHVRASRIRSSGQPRFALYAGSRASRTVIPAPMPLPTPQATSNPRIAVKRIIASFPTG